MKRAVVLGTMRVSVIVGPIVPCARSRSDRATAVLPGRPAASSVAASTIVNAPDDLAARRSSVASRPASVPVDRSWEGWPRAKRKGRL